MNRLNEYKAKPTNDGRWCVVWHSRSYPSAVWHLDTNFIPTTNKAEAEAYAAKWNS